MIRCYKDLIKLKTFKERYEYLKLPGIVGESTFGFDRYLNQVLYHSDEWRKVRRQIIMRDNGRDLGILDREIYDRIIIHHMNPITEKDIFNRSDKIFDPDYLITTSTKTHNAIHYGPSFLEEITIVERTKNDMAPWLW